MRLNCPFHLPPKRLASLWLSYNSLIRIPRTKKYPHRPTKKPVTVRPSMKPVVSQPNMKVTSPSFPQQGRPSILSDGSIFSTPKHPFPALNWRVCGKLGKSTRGCSFWIHQHPRNMGSIWPLHMYPSRLEDLVCPRISPSHESGQQMCHGSKPPQWRPSRKQKSIERQPRG